MKKLIDLGFPYERTVRQNYKAYRLGLSDYSDRELIKFIRELRQLKPLYDDPMVAKLKKAS